MILELEELKLSGIQARTSLELEMDPETAKIGETVESFFGQNLVKKIKARKRPGTTFCVYTDYESDFNGAYTFFIGEEVSDFEESLETLSIPSQRYVKFTSKPGPMPAVCIDLWQKIWAMTPEQLGGERSYIADFEVYDERAADHLNVVLDIYIGIK